MMITAKSTYRPRMSTGEFVAAVITPGVVASVEASDRLVLNEALLIVPVDTGALKESGKVLPVEQKGKTVVGGVEFSMPYAAYVEYGTGSRGAASPGAGPYPYTMAIKGQRAQPYLRPALDVARKAIRGIFASQIALRMKK